MCGAAIMKFYVIIPINSEQCEHSKYICMVTNVTANISGISDDVNF